MTPSTHQTGEPLLAIDHLSAPVFDTSSGESVHRKGRGDDQSAREASPGDFNDDEGEADDGIPETYLPVFRNVSFSVEQGEVLVVQGPSGSGKSVLLKCLAHLLVFPTGSIRLHGRTANEIGFTSWRSRVLYVPQRPALLPGTPSDLYNQVLGYAVRKGKGKQQRGQEQQQQSGAQDHVHPQDIAAGWLVARDRWDTSWSKLSGGEAQRAALAMAVALEPEVLLLDGGWCCEEDNLKEGGERTTDRTHKRTHSPASLPFLPSPTPTRTNLCTRPRIDPLGGKDAEREGGKECEGQ